MHQPCAHKYVEYWGPDGWHCVDCSGKLSPETDSERITQEQDMMESLYDEIPEGLTQGKMSQLRGVSIQFLFEFTDLHECWNKSTRSVRREIVMTETADSRCRYAELPHMKECGRTGPATTFVSHAWDGLWGELVHAISEGSYDKARFVWVDIFAIRQWPSRVGDLDFGSTIENCQSFLMFCPPIPEISKTVHINAKKLPKTVRNKVPLFRIWCNVEVHAAVNMQEKIGMPVVIRCGNFNGTKFETDYKMLEKLTLMVCNVLDSDATNPQDIADKLLEIKNKVGVDSFNHVVRSAITGAAIASR